MDEFGEYCYPDPATHEAPRFQPALIVSIRTHDLDRMAGALPGWDQQYQQLGLGPFCGELFMTQTARLSAGAASWSPGILIRGRIPRGCALFAMPLARCSDSLNRRRVLAADSMSVVFDDESLDIRSTRPLRMFLVVVQRARLEDHATALLGCPLDCIRKRGHVTINGASGKRHQLEATLRSLRAGVAQGAGHLRAAALAEAFEATILDTILTGIRAPHQNVSASRRRQLAWDAEAFLRSTLRRSISIADLCKAMNAAERTLHLAFQEHIGMSPKAYLKVLRLNAVRRDLRHPTERTNVARTAMHWGFWHLGWFSQSYLKMFGEAPIDTLRRGRREIADNADFGCLPVFGLSRQDCRAACDEQVDAPFFGEEGQS